MIQLIFGHLSDLSTHNWGDKSDFVRPINELCDIFKRQKTKKSKKINMKKICILLLLISNFTWSQNNKIQGIIKDSETFQPIPYVNIYSENELKNNSTGSISNENGEFTVINNKAKIHILPFSNLHFGSTRFFYFTFSSNPIYQVNVSLSANETT